MFALNFSIWLHELKQWLLIQKFSIFSRSTKTRSWLILTLDCLPLSLIMIYFFRYFMIVLRPLNIYWISSFFIDNVAKVVSISTSETKHTVMKFETKYLSTFTKYLNQENICSALNMNCLWVNVHLGIEGEKYVDLWLYVLRVFES